ncbi:DDE-type integrase/transposase/recombinase [Paenibacillus chondroitinus]|uniref:DDE-type integrase/transposase/recombinase n=1 Tax=Paenibacillus chondroitinus TaxID=59842 RepID=A0ABU6D4C0_9BACL|nr:MULTISPECIES: Mu transposase C-terminal domain-containing protein [Paenibacillus]MCY9661297.1 transposase family protein [Paenibacillus anseongense]MEB4792551.1 DDE-type integrase/transposase/recombinase [Paenibacillus chondroitinus]
MELLSENTILQWSSYDSDVPKIERILWTNPLKNAVITILLENEKALPDIQALDEVIMALKTGNCKVIDWQDTNISTGTDDQYEQKQLDIRNKAWEAIQSIVQDEPDCYDSRLRGVMIQESIKQTSLHKSTIYRYLRRYWQGGKVKNTLLPFYQNCGAAGSERNSGEAKRGRPRKFIEGDFGINVNEETRSLLVAGIKLFYLNRQKATLKKAYRDTLARFFTRGYKVEGIAKIPILPPEDQLPSFTQFRYWYQKDIDLQQSIIKRFGKTKFETSFRPLLGSSTYEAFGPGSRFQIDATVADVYLISEYRREWIIGRPVVYFVVDVFSRMITGMYIGLEGPSWIGAMMALANTTMDKVKYCAEYEIDIEPEDWFCSHLPQTITADRGEFEGYQPTNLIDALGVAVENTAPYRADWKGIVEQQFRLLNSRTVHFIPGAVKERERERGQRDYRLDAKLTLREFTQIIIGHVLHHNNYHHMQGYKRSEFMVVDDVPAIPRELWLWGVKNRTGRLKRQPESIVQLNLMPQGSASVTDSGIIFKGMSYSCELALKEQWFIKARAKKSWRVKVSYDPRWTNQIHVWLDDERRFEVCTLLEREERYHNKRFEEVEDLLEIEKHEGRQRGFDTMLGQIRLDAKAKAIIHEVEKKTDEAVKQSGMSQRQRVKETKIYRQIEKEANRSNEAFRPGEQIVPSEELPQKVILLTNRSKENESKDKYIPPTNKLDRIKSVLLEEGDDE